MSNPPSEAQTEPRYPLRERIALGLLKAVLWLSRRVSIDRARRIGRWLGALHFRWDGKPRRVTERNIRLAYPERSPAAQLALVRRCMEEVGALAAEMGHVWDRPWSEVSPLIVATTGTELIAQAQSEGRGVIVFAPHLGNWEVLGLHVATLGKTVALFEPPTMASIGDFIHQARQRSGSQLVPTTPRGIAELVKSVRRGGITGILPDQVPDDEQGGLNVPFMGVRCHTPTLACNLLQRSGALAVTGVAVRVKGGFAIRYALASPDVYSDDLSVALTAMNSDVERCLRGIDEQYQWQYKRFRCRPTGPIDHYLHLMQRQ